MYYDRLNEDFFIRKIREKGFRNIVQDLAEKQCEMCGVDGIKELHVEEDEAEEEYTDSDGDVDLMWGNMYTQAQNSSINTQQQSTKKVYIEQHPIARIRLCDLCMKSEDYRMIDRYDAMSKYHLPDEEWAELQWAQSLPHSHHQWFPTYWEAKVKAFTDVYYRTRFGMTQAEYKTQQEAEQLAMKNVILPARRIERETQAIEINAGIAEAINYFNDRSKLDKIDQFTGRGRLVTLMDEMLTATECPSHDTIQDLMLFWMDVKALWGLIEKYQQYLTIPINEAKDKIAQQSGHVCPFQRTNGAYTDWTLYHSLHESLPCTERDAAYALKIDAVKLISKECVVKLQHVEDGKMLLYDNFWTWSSRSLVCKPNMPEDPKAVGSFEAQYDSLTNLWRWASKLLRYDIHTSKWPEVLPRGLKEDVLRAKLLRYLRDCVRKGKADRYSPKYVAARVSIDLKRRNRGSQISRSIKSTQ